MSLADESSTSLDNGLDPERRRFFRVVIGGTTTVIAALTVLPAIGLLVAPAGGGGKKRAKLVFRSPADASSKTFVAVRYEGQPETTPGLFARQEADGSVTVLSSKCTHAGCPVEWHAADNQFFCPCHKGAFDAAGKVLSGPPKQPLQALKATRDNDTVYVELAEEAKA